MSAIEANVLQNSLRHLADRLEDALVVFDARQGYGEGNNVVRLRRRSRTTLIVRRSACESKT